MPIFSSILDNIHLNQKYRSGEITCDCVDINLTGKCTYDCLFCECQKLDYNDDLSTKELFDIADQMVEENISQAFFGGGEPLLRNDFCEIVKHFSSKGIHVSTITNGSVPMKLLDNIISTIDDCISSISVSLDSSIPDQHNLLRNNNKAYDLAIMTLEKLSHLSRTEKIIAAVVTNNNYNGFPGLIDLAKHYSFDSVVFQPVSDASNYPELSPKRAKSDLLVTHDKFKDLEKAFSETAALAAKNNINTNIERLSSWIFKYFENNKNGNIFYQGMVNSFRCIIAFNRITIRHNGNVQLCALLPRFGNIRDTKLKDLLHMQNKVKDELRAGKIASRCSKCFCGMDANLRFSMTFNPIKNWMYLLPVINKKIFT
jgi:MoaA/NifB/PqqE/SkfB family radical SAM enzyme